MNRVELHTHTKNSEMDGLIDIRELVTFAVGEGMNAVAVTDHANMDAIPEAEKVVREMKRDGRVPDKFKIIYGTEVYLVDDMAAVAVNENNQKLFSDAVIIDIETTGISPDNDSIIEIGALKLSKGKMVDSFYTLVNPENIVPDDIIELTGIDDEMLRNQPLIQNVMPQLLDFIGDARLADFVSELLFEEMNAELVGIHL